MKRSIALVAVLAAALVLAGCLNPVSGGQGTTYTVSYDPNGATAGTAPADQSKTAGTDLTLADNTGGLERDGFKFDGWNTASDGTGTSYAVGVTYTLDADLVLYAQWVDYQVGDTGPAGGIIFYDDEADGIDDISGARYLEAAPSDIAVSGDFTHVWGGRGTPVGSSAQGTAIGDGAANTAAIVAAYGASDPYNSTGNYAARLADQYEYGGYADWFLPSKDELAEMYTNRAAIGGFATSSSTDSYWSSSETGTITAAGHNFNSGAQIDNYAKDNTDPRVRVCRAF